MRFIQKYKGYRYTTSTIAFWDDFKDGFSKPYVWIYHKFEKADKTLDRAQNAADKAVDGAGNVAQGLGDLLSGNSNVLVYLGIGIVAVVVLPKLIDRVL